MQHPDFAFVGAGAGELSYVVVGHTGRNRVIAVPLADARTTYVLAGTCGLGSGAIERSAKKLDTAIDLVLKAGAV